MKALRKYIKKREEAITKLLEKDKRSYDSDTVHAIRVEIKRMNAFFHMINFAVHDFRRNKMFKPFKAVFRQAGKLRELQVEEAMLKRYAFKSLPAEYRKVLKKRRLLEQKKLWNILNSKHARRIRKAYRKVKEIIPEVSRKKVDEFLREKKEQIERNVASNSLKASQLHKLRKRLKVYEYNRSSIGVKEPKTRSVKANTLPVLLGKWHDCQVMIRHLEKVTQDRHKYPGEVNMLNNVSARVTDDRNLLLVRIKKALAGSEYHRKK